MAGVSIPEAAKHLGVAQDTIRRRIRKGILKAYQPTKGGKWVIELPEEKLPESTGEVAVLRETIALLREELNARVREVSELHMLLGQKALSGGRPWWQFWKTRSSVVQFQVSKRTGE